MRILEICPMQIDMDRHKSVSTIYICVWYMSRYRYRCRYTHVDAVVAIRATRNTRVLQCVWQHVLQCVFWQAVLKCITVCYLFAPRTTHPPTYHDLKLTQIRMRCDMISSIVIYIQLVLL